MNSLDYCYWAFAGTSIYLFILLSQKRYRLLLPSVIHTFIWTVTIGIIICQLNGFLVSKTLSNETFNLSSKFICLLMYASIIGFIVAHISTANQESTCSIKLMDSDIINDFLIKFKWIPYLCGVVGLILFIFLITTIGNINSFGDFRVLALSTERTGYAAFVQRISGHINILGLFYLMLLGYKYGKSGIELKNLLICIFLCSTINMTIGGRVWILTSLLPFLITYIYSRRYVHVDINIQNQDKKYITIIIIVFISLFSIIGLLRSEQSNGNDNSMDKFTYLTDGARMTNLVLKQYPEGTYNYEWGKSTLLQYYLPSPMNNKFQKSISHDVGLSVTVQSIMPSLYYDFGLWGGAVFYGFICFIIEYICIRLKYQRNIVSILMLGSLSFLLFQAPVGNVFVIYTPLFMWLIVIFIYSKILFTPPRS